MIRTLFQITRIGLFCSLALVFGQASSDQFEYDLEWPAVDDARVVGYRIHYGLETGNYSEVIDVGNQTSYRIAGLEPDTVYYFSVTAYDQEGRESGYTPEVTSGAFRYLFGMGGASPTDGGWIEVANASLLQEQRMKVSASDYGGSNGEVRIATGDIDGDGRDEVVLGFGPTRGSRSGGWFRILDNDLSHLAWARVGWKEYNATNGETYPAIGDLNGDGQGEIVIGLGSGGNGMLQVFRYADAGLMPLGWTSVDWPEYNAASGETRPALGDIDGNGRAELIVGLGNVAPRARSTGESPATLTETTSIPGGVFFIKHGVDISGFEDPNSRAALVDRLLFEDNVSTGVLSWADYAHGSGATWPALGDLDGDGLAEIVLGLGSGGQGLFEVFNYQNSAVASLGTGTINWPEYQSANGETRPTVHGATDNRPGQILVGLGTGGEGRVEVFEGHFGQWENTDGFEIWPADYRSAQGATWPAVKRETR